MVTHDFPPQVGGIASHVYELTKQLVKLNHHVIILSAKPKNLQKEFADAYGFQVKYVQEKFENKTRSRFLPIAIADYTIRAHFELKKIIKSHKIDFVHYHNLVPESLITKQINVPVVFTAHESHLVKSAAKNRKRLYYYLSHVNHLIAASQDRLEIARQYSPRLKSAQYLPNGVDTERFSPSKRSNQIRACYQKSSKEMTILIVSRLEEVKGIHYFIEAISRIILSIKNVRLIIVGDGTQKSKLQLQARELKIDEFIEWKGMVENKYLPDIYHLADVIVIPSLEEATSITGLEAMASGKPLIGTTVGGIPSLIDNGKNGFLVPPKEPKKLADAVVTIFHNPDQMNEMGKYSRNKAVEQFSWEKIAQETVKVYEKCYSY